MEKIEIDHSTKRTILELADRVKEVHDYLNVVSTNIHDAIRQMDLKLASLNWHVEQIRALRSDLIKILDPPYTPAITSIKKKPKRRKIVKGKIKTRKMVR